jgi:2-desacetyl-2-hydroxyethyl bacteriochlorophyllide A dehydrogenase
MKAKSFLITGPDRIEVGSVEIPAPEAGEVLLEAVVTVVSPGTELRCMAMAQPGGAKSTFIPGYAHAGRVIETGPGATLKKGTLVLAGGTQRVQGDVQTQWGGHVEYAVVKQADCFVVPEGVDAVSAAVSKLTSIAYHGYRLSNPRLDENVAVVGLGPIGMFSALLHTASGARTIGYDLYCERVELARSLGVEARLVEGDLVETVTKDMPEGADVVVDSTGAAPVLKQSILLGRSPDWGVTLRDLPRFVVQGSYPGEMTFDYQEAFMREYIMLLPRDRTPFDSVAALDLIARGQCPAGKLVGKIASPDEAPEVYKTLKESPREMLTAGFRWKD